MSDDADLTDVPYHRAHYRYTYDTIPDLVFATDPSRFLQQIFSEDGQYILGQLWGVMNVKILAERSAFEVRQRITPAGDRQAIVSLPAVGSPIEAHFMGLHVPCSMADLIDGTSTPQPETPLPLVRLLYLQEADFGLTRIVESEGRGGYLDLGEGPDPSWDGMWQIMDSVSRGHL